MSSAETEATRPKTAQEQKLADECERRVCTHDTMVRVPVQVADVEQQWCPDCVYQEFGVDYADYQAKQESILRYVTPATVASFMIGSLGMLILVSMTIV